MSTYAMASRSEGINDHARPLRANVGFPIEGKSLPNFLLEMEDGSRVPLRQLCSIGNNIVYAVNPSFKISLAVSDRSTRFAPSPMSLPFSPIKQNNQYFAPDFSVRARKTPELAQEPESWAPLGSASHVNISNTSMLPDLRSQQQASNGSALLEPHSEHIDPRPDTVQALGPVSAAPIAKVIAVPISIFCTQQLIRKQRLIERSLGTELPIGVRNMNRKKWCSHWIRHGECNFTQQGCIFKHEMPDLPILQKIGFLRVPEWYRQKEGRAKLAESRRSRPLAMDMSKHVPNAKRSSASHVAVRTIINGVTQIPRPVKPIADPTEADHKTAAAPPPSGRRDISSSPDTTPTINGHLVQQQDLIILDDVEMSPMAMAYQPISAMSSQMIQNRAESASFSIRAAAVRPSSASSNESNYLRNDSHARRDPGVIGHPVPRDRHSKHARLTRKGSPRGQSKGG